MRSTFLKLFSKSLSIGIGVIFFCLVMAAVGRGMGDTFAIFLLPLSNDLGLSRSEAASIYAVYIAAMGAFSPLSGYLFDKFGSRPIYLGGIFCLGTGYWLSGYLNTVWHFYLCMGLMSGLGAALIWQIPGQSLISRWFDKNLGTALAFIYAGFGFGILFFAPIANLLIESYGWRMTYHYFGLSFLCLIPFVAFLPWRMIEKGAPDNPRRTSSGRAEGGYSLGQALKMRAYWSMFLIYFLTAFAIFGVSVQSVAYLVELGFDEVEAAGAFGIAGVLSFAGMFLTGAAADRYGRSLVASISYFLTILGVIGLAFLQFVPDKALVLLWVIPYGLSMGARGPIIATLQAQLFAGRGLGAIYGMTMMGQGLGAGLSAWFGGMLFDLTGGYNTLFVISILSTLICVVLFWITPEIRYGRLKPATA